MQVEDKTALITGGAHRVGKAITLGLARAGANVVINYFGSASAAEETANEARDLGVGAQPFQADVSDAEQVQSMVSAAQERFGSVDILINNASLWKPTPFPMPDYSDWHRVTRVLIDGSLYCANAVAPLMLERGEGAMVNIVDLSAWQPWPNFAAHCVGKAALLALTRQLALELAPTVQVNAVAPGIVLPPPGYSEEQKGRSASRTLQNRWGTPQDVVDAVMFLVQAQFITGQVIVVDGGEQAGRYKPEPA